MKEEELRAAEQIQAIDSVAPVPYVHPIAEAWLLQAMDPISKCRCHAYTSLQRHVPGDFTVVSPDLDVGLREP